MYRCVVVNQQSLVQTSHANPADTQDKTHLISRWGVCLHIQMIEQGRHDLRLETTRCIAAWTRRRFGCLPLRHLPQHLTPPVVAKHLTQVWSVTDRLTVGPHPTPWIRGQSCPHYEHLSTPTADLAQQLVWRFLPIRLMGGGGGSAHLSSRTRRKQTSTWTWSGGCYLMRCSPQPFSKPPAVARMRMNG